MYINPPKFENTEFTSILAYTRSTYMAVKKNEKGFPQLLTDSRYRAETSDILQLEEEPWYHDFAFENTADTEIIERASPEPEPRQVICFTLIHLFRLRFNLENILAVSPPSSRALAGYMFRLFRIQFKLENILAISLPSSRALVG